MERSNPISQNQLSLDTPVWYPSEREIQLICEMLNDNTPANLELQQVLKLGEKLISDKP